MKNQVENPNGLHKKYSIKKIVAKEVLKKEGQYSKRSPEGIEFVEVPVDKDSEYFILRLDSGCSDVKHIEACRIAVNAYAGAIESHMPQLASDIRNQWPVPHQSTPVNEAKEVSPERQLKTEADIAESHYQQRFFEAVTEFENGVHSGYVMGFINGMNYRATHPIENKEGVKSAEEMFRDQCTSLDKLSDKQKQVVLNAMEDYHAQFPQVSNHMLKNVAQIEEKAYNRGVADTKAQFTPIEQGKRMVDVERLIELMNHQIAWANAEIKALPKHNDGSEEAYFKGHILGVNYCKKLLNQQSK